MAETPKIVNLYIPCHMDMFQPNTAYSVRTVLERIGDRCQYFEEQTCCGQRFYMQGDIAYAKELGVQILECYDYRLPFVVPDCNCAGYMKKYFRQLLENAYPPNQLKTFTQNIWELCDYIVNIRKITSLGNHFNHRVFYFKSCAARNLYPDNDAPEILLQNTQGLDLITDNSILGCCAANGRFATANPQAAEAMTGEIISKVYEMGAEYITSTDIHCLQHLDAYKEMHNVGIEIIHIADILRGENL